MRGRSWAFLGGVGVGALVMYFMDPEAGNRRRYLARDRMARTGRKTGNLVGGRTRDLANRARGIAARIRARVETETPSDDVLAQRVRAALGRVISHPRLISISARAGVVTLTGSVSEEECQGLTAAVRRVQGVADVIDETNVRQAAAR